MRLIRTRLQATPWRHAGLLWYNVLDAVATGSKTPSAYLHFSKDFWEARKWHAKGRSMRKETSNIMCRVPLSALSHATNLDMPLQTGHVVDLSSMEAQRPYFAAWSQEPDVQPLLMHLGHAAKVREVLVVWRGELSKSLFQVIDATTGEFLHMLDKQARLLASSHAGGQTVRKHRFSIFVRV